MLCGLLKSLGAKRSQVQILYSRLDGTTSPSAGMLEGLVSFAAAVLGKKTLVQMSW